MCGDGMKMIGAMHGDCWRNGSVCRAWLALCVETWSRGPFGELGWLCTWKLIHSQLGVLLGWQMKSKVVLLCDEGRWQLKNNSCLVAIWKIMDLLAIRNVIGCLITIRKKGPL